MLAEQARRSLASKQFVKPSIILGKNTITLKGLDGKPDLPL
jgi:hypothetical protein